MNFFFDLLFTWSPWLSFLTEIMLLQLFFVYIVYLFYSSKNLFFSSVYFLIFFFFCGIFLCYFNIEFLAGFLLVIELTVFFIFLIFFFFLNSSGNFFSRRVTQFHFFFFINFFFFFCSFFFFFGYLTVLNTYFLWDNFFESNYFLVFNDIHGFFLSYYVFNGIFFFFFGFLMFLTTLISIKILKLCKTSLFKDVSDTFFFFNFFNDLLSFDFIRKQNLNYQHNKKPVNYMVLKSLKEWSKKEVK